MALRYGWTPKNAPSKCECGKVFTVEHALSCPKGGFPILRHNEIRDFTASLLTEVCHDVQVEPELQPLTGESLTNATANSQDGARLDISANGVWGGRFEKTFLDVRVFNPLAPSNRHSTPSTCYMKHEREKKRAYEQRVREIEHASFTPLVLSSTIVGWVEKQQLSINESPLYCLTSGTIHTPRHLIGYAVAYPSHCYVPQSKQSEELDRLEAMQSPPLQ